MLNFTGRPKIKIDILKTGTSQDAYGTMIEADELILNTFAVADSNKVSANNIDRLSLDSSSVSLRIRYRDALAALPHDDLFIVITRGSIAIPAGTRYRVNYHEVEHREIVFYGTRYED